MRSTLSQGLKNGQPKGCETTLNKGNVMLAKISTLNAALRYTPLRVQFVRVDLALGLSCGPERTPEARESSRLPRQCAQHIE
jgi:hypothetical protein